MLECIEVAYISADWPGLYQFLEILASHNYYNLSNLNIIESILYIVYYIDRYFFKVF